MPLLDKTKKPTLPSIAKATQKLVESYLDKIDASKIKDIVDRQLDKYIESVALNALGLRKDGWDRVEVIHYLNTPFHDFVKTYASKYVQEWLEKNLSFIDQIKLSRESIKEIKENAQREFYDRLATRIEEEIRIKVASYNIENILSGLTCFADDELEKDIENKEQ